MSNDKVQAEIVKSLESEANYKKIVPNILKEVVASNRLIYLRISSYIS